MARLRAWWGLIGGLVAVGLIARIAPLIDASGRLLRQWPSEDGYFMLTIARNIALGHGFSIAGGAIPTNGTQPLTTLLWSVAFTLFGEDATAIRAILFVELLFSIFAAWALFSLARLVLGNEQRWAAALVSAAWFASPTGVSHSMNCLETGAYAMLAILLAKWFVESTSPWSHVKNVAFGALCGVVFLVRNDACFLILSVCLTRLILDWATPRRNRTFGQVIVMGLVSIVVSSPWLVFNVVKFGHLMPVSGRAESLTARFAENLLLLGPVLFEQLMILIPVPQRFETWWPLGVFCSAVLLMLTAWARPYVRNSGLQQKMFVCLAGIYGLGICAFYGLYFGAGWFVPRYLHPLSPFVAIAAGALLVHYVRRWDSETAFLGVVTLCAAAAVALQVRLYEKGTDHAHFHVVEWVETHVPPKTWVGAIQTGTLGFFHERTINLDGKVNAAAYEALKADREGDYVVSDTEIEYLVDWVGMLDWMKLPAVRDNFIVRVHEPANNLVVLQRKGSWPRSHK